MSHQVFISYSSKDKKFAEKIYNYLKQDGISCWISSKDIPAGADYQACIVAAISTAKIVLLIFSSNAANSPEIAKELSLASKKVIIPTRIEDVIPEGAFQYQLSNRQFIDLFEDFDARLKELSGRIKSALQGVQYVYVAPVRRGIGRKMLLMAGVALTLGCVGTAAVFFKSASPARASGPVALPAVAASHLPASTPALAAPPAATDIFAPIDVASHIPVIPVASEKPPVPAATPAIGASLEGEVSDKVKRIVIVLSDKSGSQREIALRSSREYFPQNLNAREAALLLNNTGSYRHSSIDILSEFIAANQTSDSVALVLGDLEGSARLSAIRALVRGGKIKTGLVGADITAILKNIGAYRSESVGLLVGNLAGNQDSASIAVVLGNSEGSARLASLHDVIRAGKIKSGLSAADAATILMNTGTYRSNAIEALADSLSGTLDGASVAVVLGDTEGSSRLTALQSILRASKVKTGLQPAETVIILKNTGTYRANAIGGLADRLSGNLDGESVAVVLGDTEGSSRLTALQSIFRAGKIKSGLSATDAATILKSTGSYRSNAIGGLAENLVGNLGGDGVATILGDTDGSSRLISVQSILRAGKIRSGLKPDEMQPILKNMASYTSSAVTALAQVAAN